MPTDLKKEEEAHQVKRIEALASELVDAEVAAIRERVVIERAARERDEAAKRLEIKNSRIVELRDLIRQEVSR
jgi:hypothetical protein